MNEDIIRMAREAGLYTILDQHAGEYGNGYFENTPYPELERFAQLVEEKAYAKGRREATLEFLEHLRRLHDSYSLPVDQSLMQARWQE